MKTPPYDGHAWVPIDDEITWTWSPGASADYEYTPELHENSGPKDSNWGSVDEHYDPVQNGLNEYGLDRKVQRIGTFTGIARIPNQDATVQKSVGPIVSQLLKRLCQPDIAIIEFRKLLLRLTAELEDSIEPEAPAHGG